MRLVVQMGHVARTRGATGTHGEQQYARDVAEAVVAELAARRATGVATDWTVRVIDADEPTRSYAGDAFVAVHGDGSVHKSARGASFGYRTPEGRALGLAWAQAYEDHGWTGPWRAPNYTRALARYYGTRYALRAGNRRALIVEGGFLTNPEDRALMTGPGGPERMARAIVDGVTGTTTQEQEDDMPLTEDDLQRVYATARRAVHDVIADHAAHGAGNSSLRDALSGIVREQVADLTPRRIVSSDAGDTMWLCDWEAGTRVAIPDLDTLEFLEEHVGVIRVHKRQPHSVVAWLRDTTSPEETP